MKLKYAITILLGHTLALQSHATVDFEIDLSGPQTAISPLIYGLNDWTRDESSESTGFTLERMGGNRTTSYNWENNFSNAGSDYNHYSDHLLVNSESPEEQAVPGKAVMLSINHAQSGNRPSLVTLQLAGYVPADGNGTVSEAEAAPSNRWKEVKINKQDTLSLAPDLNDDYVYLDEQVNFLVNTYGAASAGGVFAYSLDNEPALWPHTHPRIHLAQPTVAEIIEKNATCAAMVKELDPSALLFGPALYGWSAYQNFQDAPDWSDYSASYDWFLSAYLGEMKQRSVTAGQRLLDALDIHYYPEVSVVSGTDGQGNDSYTRITDSSSDYEPLTQARLQAPRSLWDTTYTEASWIAQWMTQGPIELLPRVFNSIETYYPETKLSISEYDFGGHQNYSGGLAQVDVLGIFGRDGVYASCYWGEISGFIPPAFKLYRDYDGEGSTFGDISVPTVNPDAASFSSYAAIDSATGRVHVILINKTDQAQEAQLNFGDDTLLFGSLKIYGFSEESGPTILNLDSSDGVLTPPFLVPLPAKSATLYALEPPQFKQEQIQVSHDPVNKSVKTYLRPGIGTGCTLQFSPDLVEWTNSDTTISGDDQVHFIEHPTASVDHLFWRFVPTE